MCNFGLKMGHFSDLRNQYGNRSKRISRVPGVISDGSRDLYQIVPLVHRIFGVNFEILTWSRDSEKSDIRSKNGPKIRNSTISHRNSSKLIT